MPKKANQLSALAVKSISRRGMTFVGGIDGLGLSVSVGGARSWILRAKVAGKRRDIGLGSYPEVSLATAREMAAKARQQIREGLDLNWPVELLNYKTTVTAGKEKDKIMTSIGKPPRESIPYGHAVFW